MTARLAVPPCSACPATGGVWTSSWASPRTASQRPLGRPDEYAADFALQCVARGYPAFALELIGFGERRDAGSPRGRRQDRLCSRDSMAALMLGETLAGWRVWDAHARPGLPSDADRLRGPLPAVRHGHFGRRAGRPFLAALDPRVRLTSCPAYFNTFAGSVLAVDHCVDNYVPGLLHLCEMPDLAALVAPRALFVESGRDDPIFPFAAFEQAVAQARDVYGAFGVPTVRRRPV